MQNITDLFMISHFNWCFQDNPTSFTQFRQNLICQPARYDLFIYLVYILLYLFIHWASLFVYETIMGTGYKQEKKLEQETSWSHGRHCNSTEQKPLTSGLETESVMSDKDNTSCLPGMWYMCTGALKVHRMTNLRKQRFAISLSLEWLFRFLFFLFKWPSNLWPTQRTY